MSPDTARFINNGGPAFPVTAEPTGMTLRDWFAGQVIGHISAVDVDRTLRGQVLLAYQYADAMLIERAKEPGP